MLGEHCKLKLNYKVANFLNLGCILQIPLYILGWIIVLPLITIPLNL